MKRSASGAPVPGGDGYCDPYGTYEPPTEEEIELFWRDYDQMRERGGAMVVTDIVEEKPEVVIPDALSGLPREVQLKLAAHHYISFLPPALDMGVHKDDLEIEAGLVLEGNTGWFSRKAERMIAADDDDDEEEAVDPVKLFMETTGDDVANIIEDYGRIDPTFDKDDRVTGWKFFFSTKLE